MNQLSSNKNFLAGLLMISIGIVAFYMALDYPFGSAVRMGPGYFPRVLAGILIAFGIVTMIKGLKTGEKVEGKWGWYPLMMILISLVVYGFTMDKFGLVPALVSMFFISALAGHEFNFKEVTILTVVMTIFAILVFVKGLGLPYPLVEGF